MYNTTRKHLSTPWGTKSCALFSILSMKIFLCFFKCIVSSPLVLQQIPLFLSVTWVSPLSPTIYHEVVSCLCIVVRLFCQSLLSCILGFPGGTMEKNLPANPDDSGSGWVSSPGLGNGNPLLYSCLENPMGRRAWWASVHGVTNSWAWLSNSTHTGFCHFPKWFFFNLLTLMLILCAEEFYRFW